MSNEINKIVIVGGGTAGWITAALLAAEHVIADDPDAITIDLIESPNVPTIGVGEGTWPTMRDTLKTIGIDEDTFLKECDASFKQGSTFVNWQTQVGDQYYHPFTLPEKFHQINLASHWLPYREQVCFSQAVSFQQAICEQGLAPKQITNPQYSFVANYGYHLDAGKFSNLLKKHCIENLNVNFIAADVVRVTQHNNGDIKSVITSQAGEVAGDLFIDCTGAKGLLINETLNVPFVSQKQVLFNDRAIAAHVPYSAPDEPIQSTTLSTAQDNGWIWDIGLQSRRGIGYVYSSQYENDQNAEATLRQYIAQSSIGEHRQKMSQELDVRQLKFEPGHRATFWQNNCVAIGMSAGFIEPLEASAIALIELSAKYISAQLPRNKMTLGIVRNRFNEKFAERWQQIIEFLKLHYVLSKRTDSRYWLDNTNKEQIPAPLKQKLTLWQFQAPYSYDATATEALFPPASYQYVYYGMGGETKLNRNKKWLNEHVQAQELFQNNNKKTSQMLPLLIKNRELLNKIAQFGLSKI